MRRRANRPLFAVLLLGIGAAWASEPEGARAFRFALIGDLPYNAVETRLFRQTLEQIGSEELAFVIHIGDIKSGSSSCADSVLEARIGMLERSEHPLVLLFGDNEWTDCYQLPAGGYDPMERLSWLRRRTSAGEESLGRRRLRLERQTQGPGAYPENVRWSFGGVRFVGLHVVGSRNNFGRTPAMNREYEARNAANLVWLRASFALARGEGAAAVVVAFHADPRFEKPAGDSARRGFEDTLAALVEEVRRFPGPVVLLHGDTHRYRVDHPLIDPATNRPLENFTRVESFGSPHVRWVRATFDPQNPLRFRFEPGADRPDSR